jgi:CheY-like chemotaxis protein
VGRGRSDGEGEGAGGVAVGAGRAGEHANDSRIRTVGYRRRVERATTRRQRIRGCGAGWGVERSPRSARRSGVIVLESNMGVRVLVVDDDPDIRLVVKALLATEAIDVDEAGSVKALFETLDAGPLPDVILLDLTMPGPSGWNVLPKLQEDPVRAKIPVIVLTGHNDPEFKNAAKTRGAAGYITKPFKDWELIDAVKRHVKHSRRTDPWA